MAEAKEEQLAAVLKGISPFTGKILWPKDQEELLKLLDPPPAPTLSHKVTEEEREMYREMHRQRRLARQKKKSRFGKLFIFFSFPLGILPIY